MRMRKCASGKRVSYEIKEGVAKEDALRETRIALHLGACPGSQKGTRRFPVI